MHFFKFRIVLEIIICACLVAFSIIPARALEVPLDVPTASESSAAAEQMYQFPKDEFYTGEVVGILKEGTEELGGYSQHYQVLAVKILDGKDKGKVVEIHQGEIPSVTTSISASKGDKVVLARTQIESEVSYAIIDQYRLTPLIYLGIGFVILILIFGRIKGLMSLFGLGFSVFILGWYMIPQIIAGNNPVVVTLGSILIIAFVSLYLAHGFNKRTTLALISTLITLSFSIVIAVAVVSFTKLTGLGSEEAFFLQLGPLGRMNLQGLLLGGILIGTLGVLDDITTAQTAAVEEIGKANPTLDVHELYSRGISVGREHIASLVNTLVLAYAGSSLPLFILFTINRDQQPLWITLNSEQIIEEIIRTAVGSSALILAVPISTLLAAVVYGYKKTAGNS